MTTNARSCLSYKPHDKKTCFMHVCKNTGPDQPLFDAIDSIMYFVSECKCAIFSKASSVCKKSAKTRN